MLYEGITDAAKADFQRAWERADVAILMDCSMPVLDGIAATRKIRADEEARAGGHVPILAITAHAADQHQHPVDGRGHDQDVDHVARRITSYNVCYTKLLRLVRSQFSEAPEMLLSRIEVPLLLIGDS